jgi:hypothetical protein
MKKLPVSLLLAATLAATSLSLMSCEKDDADVEIIEPRAGDYVGADKEDGIQYITRIYNMVDKSDSLFIENIGNLGLRSKFYVNGQDVTVAPTPYDFPIADTAYSVSLSGTGKIEGDTLKLQYTLSGPYQFFELAFGDSLTSYTGNFAGSRESKAPIIQGR